MSARKRHRADTLRAAPARAPRRARRSHPARGVQQPVHGDRRADGRGAAQHRAVGQHQGAARFLVRGFRCARALVANAPHLPVHLGSMDRSVETIIRERGAEMRPGDVYMLNAPYNGGTHLPDITVVTPVFDAAGAEVLFYVASRGHHEDIGGLTPGSMTPRATTIEEEGVYIDNVKLVDRGRFLGDGDARAADRRKVSRAPAGQEHRRPEGAGRRQRQGRGRAPAHGRALRARRRAGLHGPRAGQRRGGRAPPARAPRRRALPRRDRPRHGGGGAHHRRSRGAHGDGRLHRHERAAADQLQRARAGDARGRALRLPRHGRRRHPDERRLPAADQDRHPRRLDAAPDLPRRRRRRQRGDEPDRHQLAVCRASARSARRKAR